MLLVGRQEGHLACKNRVMRYWHCYLSGARFICIWSGWCHCHPIIFSTSKIQNGLSFWCRLTQVALVEKGCYTDVVGLVVVVVIIKFLLVVLSAATFGSEQTMNTKLN